jgi:hypothetical protein
MKIQSATSSRLGDVRYLYVGSGVAHLLRNLGNGCPRAFLPVVRRTAPSAARASISRRKSGQHVTASPPNKRIY